MGCCLCFCESFIFETAKSVIKLHPSNGCFASHSILLIDISVRVDLVCWYILGNVVVNQTFIQQVYWKRSNWDKRSSTCQAMVKKGKKTRAFTARGSDSVNWSVTPDNIRAIQSVSLHERVKSSEIQTLVKEQLQLHSKVLQQDSRIALLPSDGQGLYYWANLKLKALISSDSSSSTPTQNSLHVTLNDQPSILSNARIRHKLKEDGKEQWLDDQVPSFARLQKVRDMLRWFWVTVQFFTCRYSWRLQLAAWTVITCIEEFLWLGTSPCVYVVSTLHWLMSLPVL